VDRAPSTQGGRSRAEHKETEFGRNSRVPPENSSSGQPTANPKLKPPRRKRRAKGQPQKIRVGAPKLARGANTRAHEGRCRELGLQREGDIPSVAVTGPISLQLNVEGRDTTLGCKSGTPPAQGVTTKCRGDQHQKQWPPAWPHLATQSSGSNGKECRKRWGETG
jgi:hypothetical protein